MSDTMTRPRTTTPLTTLDRDTEVRYLNPHTSKSELTEVVSADGVWLFVHVEVPGTPWDAMHLPSGLRMHFGSLRDARRTTAAPDAMRQLRAIAADVVRRGGRLPGLPVSQPGKASGGGPGQTRADVERLGFATRALAVLDGHLVAGTPDGVCLCGAYLVGDHHGDVCNECIGLDTDDRRRCRAGHRHTACGPIGDPAQCDHLQCKIRAGAGQYDECASGADLCCGCCHNDGSE